MLSEITMRAFVSEFQANIPRKSAVSQLTDRLKVAVTQKVDTIPPRTTYHFVRLFTLNNLIPISCG